MSSLLSSFWLFNHFQALGLTCYSIFAAFKGILPSTRKVTRKNKIAEHILIYPIVTQKCKQLPKAWRGCFLTIKQKPDMDKTIVLQCITFWYRKFHYILCKRILHISGIKVFSLTRILFVAHHCIWLSLWFFFFFFWFHCVSIVL